MMAAANKKFALTAGGFAPLTRHTMIMVSHEVQLLGVRRCAVLGAKKIETTWRTRVLLGTII
jgi:hypothetical protein